MNAKATHKESLTIREQGDFEEALKLNASALIKYQQEKDSVGFSEALADQTIILRHLYWQTNSKDYLILAKHVLEAAIEIGKKSNQLESLPIPLFNLGKVNTELEDYPAAIHAYKKAIQHQLQNPSHNHNRPAVMADFIIHHSVAEYKNGDKTAKERLIAALTELESTTEEKYNKLVWTSGAYMYLADMLKDDEPDVAKHYLANAKEIIDTDKKLILRKDQWEKLSAKFK